MTSGPINLNKARKSRARARKKAQADANAVRFGRSRSEKAGEKAAEEKARRDHAGHKLE